MLRLFAGRENIDKERFIYENIAGETLVIVPDQYTLVAEEQALKYMHTDCLFDTEILSMNRLGLRLLTEQGLESVTMLDKYGRYMLLGKLIREHRDEFDIFRRSAGKMTFTSMLNDFISEFKQQDSSLGKIEEMIEDEKTDPLLRAKLRELAGVIRAYEEEISGRYTDSEDYIARYVDAIRESELIRNKSIWIYGYDSITPKFAKAMIELAGRAREVSFIVNRSDFALDEKMIRLLFGMGQENGIRVTIEEIGREYISPKSETVRRIERGLWNDDLTPDEIRDNAEFLPEDLVMVSAANPYYEAESAAAYIWHLVRDLGYRMSDIQVIANDEGTMQPITRRIFEEYGLPVFMDSSRDITDTAAVAFIVNLLWFIVHGRSSQYLLAMLKTGLAGYEAGQIEDLENYARDYRIRGTMWDRQFKYGADAIGEEQLAALDGMRADIMEKIGLLEAVWKRPNSSSSDQPAVGSDKPECIGSEHITVSDFVTGFRTYLNDVWGLDEAVQAAADAEDELGLHEEAQRNLQSYDKALEIMDQVAEIIGDQELDIKEFTDIYVTGLTNVEVGVIPPAVDGLSMGTMIRTRPRPVRAAVILGANEGVLPLSPSPEGLFSTDEKAYFKANGFKLGELDDIKQDEENAAMYRILSRPSEKLYISWSATDAEGADMGPSSVIDTLTALFPRINTDGLIRRDIISEGWKWDPSSSWDTISREDEALRHLIERIKDRSKPDGPDPLKDALLRWYGDNRSDEIGMLLRAAADENTPAPLGSEVAAGLFKNGRDQLVLSASSIGSYFDCPFKFFVDRGLKPREEREFTGDSRSIGDAYHECLMAVARRLLGDRELLSRIAAEQAASKSSEPSEQTGDAGSGQQGTADLPEDGGKTDALLQKLVSEELIRISEEYRGGLFISTGSEDFRMSRIREICTAAARAMAVQLSADSVMDAAFEEGFSRHGRFDPIRISVGDEEVLVEGKIDRYDVLNVDGEERIRIIDYKTGSDKLDLWKMRNGYKMQLMIYMISASSGGMEPAGLFYFNIKDPITGIDSKKESEARTIAESEPEDIYKLNGRYINEPGVLDAMPESVLGGKTDKTRSMLREEFEEVRAYVLTHIEETAAGILKGKIDIRPLKTDNKKLVCTFCSYRSICRRDREYFRNSGREIPPAPKEP